METTAEGSSYDAGQVLGTVTGAEGRAYPKNTRTECKAANGWLRRMPESGSCCAQMHAHRAATTTTLTQNNNMGCSADAMFIMFCAT